MDQETLKNKIKTYARKIYKEKIKSKEDPSGFGKLSKFPPLKQILIDLLTEDFSFFIKGVDWTSPRPTTFYIRLKNGMGFYLMHGSRSWIAQVEGKKYYLLNQDEEENAAEAISRMLRYYIDDDSKDEDSEENEFTSSGSGGFESAPPEPEIDLDSDVE